MALTFLILGALAVGAALALRPRADVSAVVALAVGAATIVFDSAGAVFGELLARQVLPLLVFLTAAIWLAALADRSGLAQRVAAVMVTLARGRRSLLYPLVCLLSAALTATVSLDGAVVVMVPVVLALAREDGPLLRVLLLGAIAVSNSFSLATPQGNPTNLVVMSRLDLDPGQLAARLAGPALLAALVCALALALVERRALSGARVSMPVAAIGGSPRARALAAVGLLLAAGAGVTAPWIGLGPVWAISGAAAVTAFAALLTRTAVPRPAVPWRVGGQVAGLVVVLAALAARVELPMPSTGSLAALLTVAAIATVVAGAVGNLPASVTFASLLGGAPLPAYAALAGLSVGALATPHGSVATLIALDRSGSAGQAAAAPRYLRLWAPVALASTGLAVLALWAGGGA